MSDWLHEAGDPRVEPLPEHVQALRSRVLDQLGPLQEARPRMLRWLLGTGVAALVVVGLVVAMSRPKVAWAQVAQAMQGKPWVHSRTLGPDDKVYAEAWFSPKASIVAGRRGETLEYHDHTLRIYMKYVPAEGILYRLPESSDRQAMSLNFYEQLLDTKGPAKSPLPGMEVVGQSRREVEDGGKTWLDIELTLRIVGNTARGPQRMTIRVDPTSKLPKSWTTNSDGMSHVTLFDYPDSGPADIYQLGAPRDAKVIDRIPGDDLDRILAGLKAGRNRFDDYRAIMLFGVEGRIGDANRVWRKGRKWRIEKLLARSLEWPAEASVDPSWWATHQNDYVAVASAICDGEKIRYYRLAVDSLKPNFTKLGPPVLSMTQAINPSDDPLMPWPHMMPEQIGHPSVWQPSDDREFVLEPKPDDGPPGTIRVRVRNTHATDPKQPDLYRLWVAPNESYLSLKTETAVFSGANSSKVEYIDTTTLEDLKRSPGGYWYPGRVRRKTSNFPGVQVTRFFLDFDAKIPETLFQPLEPKDQ